jgi:hypothetical protein
MQIEHLVYCGNREQGTLTVGRVDILSPFRRIKFYKGLRLEVGKAIPNDIAAIIAKDYPSVFEIEKKDLDDVEAYVLQLSDIMEECLAVLGDVKALTIAKKAVEKNFDGYSICDNNVKENKEVSTKKPKTKRRRTK